jgi:hypothetical protein
MRLKRVVDGERCVQFAFLFTFGFLEYWGWIHVNAQ